MVLSQGMLQPANSETANSVRFISLGHYVVFNVFDRADEGAYNGTPETRKQRILEYGDSGWVQSSRFHAQIQASKRLGGCEVEQQFRQDEHGAAFLSAGVH